MKATNRQLVFINKVEKALTEFEVRFEGTTKAEASEFIAKYKPYFQDVDRLNRGYPPYHTNYPVMTSYGTVYQPTHFTVIPEIQNYIRAEWEEMQMLRGMLDNSAGDGWGEYSW